MTNYRTWILFFFLFALLGYFREFFFVHLNIILYNLYYQRIDPSPVPTLMKGFEHFSYSTLYFLKYPFTLLSTLLFYGLNYFALKYLSYNPYLRRILLYAFVCMLSIAAFSMLYAYFVKEQLNQEEYTLSRWLLGIAQSPIICLILLASEKLLPKQPSV